MPVEEVADIVAMETGDYRERLYPPLTALRLFIGQVLSEDRACLDVVGRHLSERVAEGCPGCGLNTGPYPGPATSAAGDTATAVALDG